MDVKKAFDSVSHQSILVAAARLGIPPPFLTYLRELYGDVQTRLRIGTELSEPIKLGWGVRQGDPMSVHLFNAMIDLSLDGLDPELGTEIGGVKVWTGTQYWPARKVSEYSLGHRWQGEMVDRVSTSVPSGAG